MPLIKYDAATDRAWDVAADTDAEAAACLNTIAERSNATAVELTPDDDVEALRPFLGQLATIIVTLPKFNDGRAFSQARLIRDRLGYTGELRAIGHILPDQFAFLVRVGVDAIEIDDPARAKDFARRLNEMRVVYQPSQDAPHRAWATALRHANKPARATA